jgi:hypothetical protein
MANRLLDRQASLLTYLTSGSAIFGEERGAGAEGAPAGMDPALLHLEARFSYEKRLEKIAAVLPRTFALLGRRLDSLMREFVDACPPADIGRVANARQFHDFLAARWRDDPAWLPDMTACELACAAASLAAADVAPPARNRRSRRGVIRRRPGVVLVRCRHDIQHIFEQGGAGGAAPARDLRLAVAVSPGTSQPRVCEIPIAVFELLTLLDDWADPAALGGADELIRDLAAHGLIEVSA